MARMHSGKHGKSKSRKPTVEIGSKPEWLKLSTEEIEDKIVNYAKQGVRPAQIGQKLKNEDNVLYIKQAMSKRLGVILKEKKVAQDLPADLTDLIRKALKMRKHLEKNKQDVHNRIRLVRTESKIWRLSKYYKKSGTLPVNWKYDPEKAALTIKV
ncbi:MAG: 30S ribosomal protein S15 [Candidatus Marsarchaeota archaeon]|jgi:small subunit ribosomal protein S15|nr:30S ribosomal protein S15 [Candidatus Marsarchaeota archaeon]